jgi:hypothetical protein
LLAGDVAAWCSIERGKVVVLADAALLDLHSPHPAAAGALKRLVELSSENGDGAGRDMSRSQSVS